MEVTQQRLIGELKDNAQKAEAVDQTQLPDVLNDLETILRRLRISIAVDAYISLKSSET